MRGQAARDEQTLDIAAAILVTTALWGVLVAVAAVVASLAGTLDDRADVVLPFVLVGYGATIVQRLRPRGRTRRTEL